MARRPGLPEDPFMAQLSALAAGGEAFMAALSYTRLAVEAALDAGIEWETIAAVLKMSVADARRFFG